jgi:hypothetical protein
MIKTLLNLLFYNLKQICDSCGRPNTLFQIYKNKAIFFSFYILIFSPLTLEILIYLEDIKWHDLVNVFESVDHLQVIASCSY